MLVLTRKHLESVKIGPDITVTVRIENDGRVKLAIDAPKQILVLRSELVPGNSPKAVRA